MTTDIKKQRAEFNAWWESDRLRTWVEAGCEKDRGPVPTPAWGSGFREHAWSGWLAARSAQDEDAERWIAVRDATGELATSAMYAISCGNKEEANRIADAIRDAMRSSGKADHG